MEGAPPISVKPNSDALLEIERWMKAFYPPVVQTPVLALFCIPGEVGIRAWLCQPTDAAIPSLHMAYVGVLCDGGRINDEWMDLFKAVVTQENAHSPLLPETVPSVHPDIEASVKEITNIMDAQIKDSIGETSYLLIYMDDKGLTVKGGSTDNDYYEYPIIPFLYLLFSSRLSDPPYLTDVLGDFHVKFSLTGLQLDVELFVQKSVRQCKRRVLPPPPPSSSSSSSSEDEDEDDYPAANELFPKPMDEGE